ncbi:hypothetical protein RAB80_014362 [Fusarium oxysporum f. sp. vasinfectum]|nr:hypothetical protein RAB80_014362 [Fusarium oxysporum f. sp. vasinfectum]
MLLISIVVLLLLQGTTTHLSNRLQDLSRLMAMRELMTVASLRGGAIAGRQRNRMTPIDRLPHEVPWTKTRAEGLQPSFRITAAQVKWGTLCIRVQDSPRNPTSGSLPQAATTGSYAASAPGGRFSDRPEWVKWCVYPCETGTVAPRRKCIDHESKQIDKNGS